MNGRGGRTVRPDLAGAAVAARAAMAVAAPALANGFTYDAVVMVQQNPAVHALRPPWTYLGESYWGGQLYRPLVVLAFALEWAAGGGAPLAFQATSVVLAGLAAFLVTLLLTELVPGSPGRLAALLFAVHPVHVEAVAGIVGQSELLVTAAVAAAAWTYVRGRRAGPFTPARLAALAALALVAALSKEQGFMLPFLLGALEFVLLRRDDAGAHRDVRAGLLAAAAPLALVLTLRTAVLGSAAGAVVAPALAGLDVPGRVIVALGVTPQWVRLLLWPAHLQAEYGPPALSTAPVVGAAQALGLACLAGLGALCWWARRRAPAAIAGIAWTALALAPVSNVPVATGIVLAERTLYLPSVGAMLLVAALAAALADGAAGPARRALAAALLLAAALGAARSVSRAGAWRSNATLFPQLVAEAPESYRAWKVYARHLLGTGDVRGAEAALRRALALWNGDPEVHEDLSLLLRKDGRCAEAVPVMAAVGRWPDEAYPQLRARYFHCLAELGRWEEAARVARDAVATGNAAWVPLAARADSALRAGAVRPSSAGTD